MNTGTLPPVSSRADYIETYQILDEDDETDPVDVSTASDITIEIRNMDSHAVLYTASLANGRVTHIETGVFQWNFPASDMQNLCEQSYEIAGRITMDGETAQLFLMTLPVVTG